MRLGEALRFDDLRFVVEDLRLGEALRLREDLRLGDALRFVFLLTVDDLLFDDALCFVGVLRKYFIGRYCPFAPLIGLIRIAATVI